MYTTNLILLQIFFSWEVILYISRDFIAYHYENVVKILMEITSLKILDWK